MSTTTYVTVTNNAIEESGADLATFDTGGADWSSNTNTLMNRMKRYVARAWRDIQQEAFDWGFLEEQAVVNVNPGVMFYTDGFPFDNFSTNYEDSSIDIFDQDGSTAISAIPAGAFTDLTGISTDTKPFGYFDVTTTASTPITWSLKPGAEYFALSTTLTVDVSQTYIFATATSVVNNLSLIPTDEFYVAILQVNGNTYDVVINHASYAPEVLLLLVRSADSANIQTDMGVDTTPSIVDFFDGSITYLSFTRGSILVQDNQPLVMDPVTYARKAYIHSWKSFNFSEEIGVDDFQESIKEVDQKSFRTIDYFKAPATGEVPINYVPWEDFQRLYDISSAPPGIPRIITRDNTNRFRLYPHPYYIFTLKFDYTRVPQIISAYNDVFKGLDEDYVDIVMWKALIYYGEFDEQPSVTARATKNYKNFLTRLEQLYRQKFHFKPARLC